MVFTVITCQFNDMNCDVNFFRVQNDLVIVKLQLFLLVHFYPPGKLAVW